MFNKIKNPVLKSTTVILLTALFIALFHNASFFRNISNAYQIESGNILTITSTFVILFCSLVFLFSFFVSRHTAKPALIMLVLISSVAAYFMDSYNIIIDSEMIVNATETDSSEAFDLFNLQLLVYLFFLGLIPGYLIYKANIKFRSTRTEIFSRLATIASSLLVIIVIIYTFSDFYASFFRDNKLIRYYTTPTTPIYSLAKFVSQKLTFKNKSMTQIGENLQEDPEDEDRELIIVIVGETARADHFSLNGYARKTNPILEKEEVYSFSKFTSCGTSTAYSVPCMFSMYGRDDYSNEKGSSTENLLDLVSRADANILWRDNNSSSKGVADRVTYENFRTAENNPICDIECRDVGMLAGLQEHIDAVKEKDILIVLHQMGNHGPAYYKRYPEEFGKFFPVCKNNQLDQCSQEEIVNAYDNAIIYTDYFLSRVIDLLKQNSARFETSMIYASDHGESLGENGLYLHGLPYMLAPKTQTHVPAILWFGDNYNNDELNREVISSKLNQPMSHDNLFHTLMSIMELSSDEYDQSLSIMQ